MTILLDTHILLWALGHPERLSGERRQRIQDRSNTVLVSAVNIAEIAIKSSLGKLEIEGDLLAAVQDAGFDWLDFTPAEAALLRDLPYHHRDPFDRMLVVQSMENDLFLMTDDRKLDPYGCRLI